MHEYLIQYEIKTPAYLVKSFEYGDFRFEAWRPESWDSEKWVASRTIESKNYVAAYKHFIKELISLNSRLSVVSQCAFQLRGSNFLIYRLDDNVQRNIFINYTQPRDVVGLPFDEQEINNLQKLDPVDNPDSLIYLKEAAEAITPYTRLAMLLMAAEGLAGRTERVSGRIQYSNTNKNKLKEIISEDLFEQLYKGREEEVEERIRHKLLHGNMVDDSIIGSLNEPLYQNILTYLSRHYLLNFTPAVNSPRSFHGEYEYSGHFYKIKDDSSPNLRSIYRILFNYFNNPSRESVNEFREFFDEDRIVPEAY